MDAASPIPPPTQKRLILPSPPPSPLSRIPQKSLITPSAPFRIAFYDRYRRDPLGMLLRNRIYIFQTPDGRRQKLFKSPVAARKVTQRKQDVPASPSPKRQRALPVSPYTPIRGDDGVERLKEKEATRSDVATTPFEQLPDYTPPVTTLNAKGKTLKVEWKGSPVDLSNDPDLGFLHPEEAKLAALLRLSVQQYRDCKLRIFWEFHNRRLQSKTFRRTDSQRVCRVDVNKASKLWAAFEKVGWFDDDLWKKIDQQH